MIWILGLVAWLFVAGVLLTLYDDVADAPLIGLILIWPVSIPVILPILVGSWLAHSVRNIFFGKPRR